MAWIVTADLNDLLSEVNACGPNRDKRSDGSIGNEEHQARKSDHNPDDTPGSLTPHTDADSIAEVHARDFDASGPWLGTITAAKIVDALVTKMRALGTRAPLAYVIYNRRIYEYPHFANNPYTRDNPHTGIFHCSSRYGSGSGSSNPENYTGSWGIREALLMLSTEDKSWISSRLAATAEATASAVWNTAFTLPDGRVLTAGTIIRWLDAAQLDTRAQVLAAIAAITPVDPDPPAGP